MSLEFICRGRTAVKGVFRGPAYILEGFDPAFKQGSILVAKYTSPDLVPNMLQSKGIITEIGTYASHAAIVAREFGLPCVVGAEGLLDVVQNGMVLYVEDGEIYKHVFG